MGSRFGSLGDFFPDTEVKCRVHGCENMIHVSGEEAIQKLARGKSPRADKMCDECYARLQTLEDKELPCSTAGCSGTWVWNRYQQLEAYAVAKGGEPQPPRGLCAACKEHMSSLQPQERPCRLRGCKNTWTWTAREQQAAGGKPPIPRLCNECFAIYKNLKDIELPCRIKGCEHKVLWTKYQQLEHVRAGKSLDNPPSRMCDDCLRQFSSLKNEERPCKINGCSGTWVLTAFEHLEILRNTPEGKEPEYPQRMCKACFDFYMNAKDIEVPCRNKGCKNTWVWTRSMQLGAHVHGIDHPTVKLCADCIKTLSQLHDEERPCTVSGCTGKWIYRAEEQLRDKCAMREEPHKRCPECQEFLQTHKAETLTCATCGKPFSWSAQEQLSVKLGVFVKPEKCPDCVRREIAGLKSVEPADLIKANRPQIRIPVTGAWKADSQISDWPVRMDRDSIDKMERSALRIVCIGDESTVSVDPVEQSWPALLEKQLRKRYANVGKVGIVNAGIKGTGVAQAIKRFGRDVEPFRPQLVVFSFSLADSMLKPGSTLTDEEQTARLSELSAQLEGFADLFKGTNCQLLCWLPNPIFPQNCQEGKFDAEAFKAWCERQTRFYDAVQNTTKKLCEKRGIQCVDARSLFEVNGVHSAQKSMSDWCMHNQAGAMNIANWLEGRINEARMLQGAIAVIESQKAEAASIKDEKSADAQLDNVVSGAASEPASEESAAPSPVVKDSAANVAAVTVDEDNDSESAATVAAAAADNN